MRHAEPITGRSAGTWRRGWIALGVLTLGAGLWAFGWTLTSSPQIGDNAIPSGEFVRMVDEFSEQGGYFLSDNLVSNETSYLHVLNRLRELGSRGEGAYIGVGPEQNFTYIAAMRPQIAFIVDIRRAAMLQQLVYKSVFHLSPHRLDFLARLFSKTPAGASIPGQEAPLSELVKFLEQMPGSEETFRENLATLLRTIEGDFGFPLSEQDRERVEYIHTMFWERNLDLRFWFHGRWSWGGFPTLRTILLETDLEGEHGSFLARESDYQFVRRMQLQNRIIPVVGDFAGTKAISRVADYLAENRYPVSVFYTSNVEQYLFRNGVFGAFVRNVRQLPVTERSLFIRAFTGIGGLHPARVSGHRLTTTLQKMEVFLEDYDQGLYPDYWRLVTTHYISGTQP